MALKTGQPKAEASEVAPSETTVLELALYKIYTWGANTYETGKPYRFKNADAMTLLAEQDLGRPVWRLWRKPVPKQAPKNEIVDATMIHAPVPVDDFGAPLVSADTTAKKRIEIGTDDEIADILNKDTSGDVTV